MFFFNTIFAKAQSAIYRLGLLVVATAGFVLPVTHAQVINEFVFNHTGSDDTEYVEIFGAPNRDYPGLTILQIEGDGPGAGVVDAVIPVGRTDANGIWVSEFFNNVFENGDVTLLLVQTFTGSLGDDLDTDNDGIFDSTPWRSIVDGVAVEEDADDLRYTDAVLTINFDGLNFFTVGGASRIPDGQDTDTAGDWVRNDFNLAGIPGESGTIEVGEAFNTPGASNRALEPEPAMPVFIHEVQGSGLSSPLEGKAVIVEGVVVGQLTGSNGTLEGFYLMEEDADADKDPSTSEGIFVFSPSSTGVAVGDKVKVEGLVSERFDLTQINPAEKIENTGPARKGLPTAAGLYFPVEAVNDLEAFEAMRVVFKQSLIANDLFNLGRFNEILLATDILNVPTDVAQPGAPANNLEEANELSSILLDDASNVQNPEKVRFLSEHIAFRRGAELGLKGVTGVLDEAFGAYRVRLPLSTNIPLLSNPSRPKVPSVGGRLQVASFNVLNLFSTIDQGGNRCGPNNEGCRGADTPEELERQLEKLVPAILELDADVVGLQELENNPVGNPTLELLVNRLNAAGGDTYDYIASGPLGPQVIKVGIIYKTQRVEPSGDFAVLDQSVDPRFDETLNRAALAQTFLDRSTRDKFTVVVNHLKSKSGSRFGPDSDPRDGDLGDGQGFFNFTRTQAAEALADWVAIDPTNSDDPDYLIIGDLNAYREEDPVKALQQGGFTNVIEGFRNNGQGRGSGDPNPYTFVFFGQEGQLDYLFANDAMTERITGAGIWHINADEPRGLDYNNFNQDFLFEPNPFRSSDHDPILIGLTLSKGGRDRWTASGNSAEGIGAAGLAESGPDARLTEGAGKIALFPNPVRTELLVDAVALGDANGVYRILSAAGQVVRQGVLDLTRDRIIGLDVRSLNPGMYILEVVVDNRERMSERFIIQR